MAELRRLGTSDIEVTPIGLGCWQFSENRSPAGKFWDAVSPETTTEVVQAALEGGINWFDTAEAYGNGRSEAGLARSLKALGKQPGEIVIATKWLPFLRTASSLIKTMEDRLRFLDGFPIDLHQIHQPIGALSSHKAQMEALAQLVKQGKTKTAGISNFSASQMSFCHAELARHGVPLVSNQVKYSLLDRRIESRGVIKAAKELGVTIIAYSPLEQGLLTGKFHDDPNLIKTRGGPRRFLPAFRSSGLAKSRPVIDSVRRIADEHGVSPAQVALRWLTDFHGDTVVVIPGGSKRHHSAEAAAALSLELSPKELEELDVVSRPYL